jgi:hypothetical protein
MAAATSYKLHVLDTPRVSILHPYCCDQGCDSARSAASAMKLLPLLSTRPLAIPASSFLPNLLESRESQVFDSTRVRAMYFTLYSVLCAVGKSLIEIVVDNDKACVLRLLSVSMQAILPVSFALMHNVVLHPPIDRQEYRDFSAGHQSIPGIRECPYHVPSMIISIMPKVDCAS